METALIIPTRLVKEVINGRKYCYKNRKTYQMVVGEPGLRLGTNSNCANNIAIYRKADLSPDRDRTNYFSVAPFVAIEVDVPIEAEDEGLGDFSCMFEKSSPLIESGTATVVWVLSRLQPLVVFAPGTDGSIQPQVIPWAGLYALPAGRHIRLAGWLEAEGESDLLKS